MGLVIASQQKLLSVMPSRGLLFFYMLKRACLVENWTETNKIIYVCRETHAHTRRHFGHDFSWSVLDICDCKIIYGSSRHDISLLGQCLLIWSNWQSLGVDIIFIAKRGILVSRVSWLLSSSQRGDQSRLARLRCDERTIPARTSCSLHGSDQSSTTRNGLAQQGFWCCKLLA
jgi:hypothetical protein